MRSSEMLGEKDSSAFLTLFSLLNYYQSGSYITFRLAVEKLLKYHGIVLSDQLISKLARYVLNRFVEMGIIEIALQKGQRSWEICGNSIVSLSEDKHVLVGDKIFCHSVATRFEIILCNHLLFTTPAKICPNLDFHTPSINCRLSQLSREKKLLPAFNHLIANESRLIQMLPTMQDNLKYLKKIDSKILIDQSKNVFSYNFVQKKWDSESTEYLEKPGYYQVKQKFGPPTFLIKSKDDYFELIDGSLGFVLACYLLHYPVYIQYKKSDRILFVDYRDFFNLPTIFKRALLLKSFVFPVFLKDRLVINNIELKEYTYLLVNYKFFTGEING